MITVFIKLHDVLKVGCALYSPKFVVSCALNETHEVANIQNKENVTSCYVKL